GLPLVDVPQTPQDVQAVLAETRQHGLGRVVHSLLPGVGGFCAPVFDAQGRLAMGLVVLGSVATLDTRWDSAPASALLRCAQQLSADLGHRAPA
ncbi:MAG: IclR family transcriptional regulator, partial [Gammaproteobacteria bacterium]|nr:IclR family transcriptional regulator [Gammaproteobacteria bacterium]